MLLAFTGKLMHAFREVML